MAKFRRKGTWKKILAGALAVVLGIGAIAGISALVSNRADDDGKVTINPKWAIGGLDENGKYEESEATLYTKDAFECQGLTIIPNFDSNVQYQIFFYSQIGEFISSSQILDTAFDDDIPAFATQARLEVTPVWDEDVKEKDQVIKWYNKNKWQGQLEIKVNKEQDELFGEEFIFDLTTLEQEEFCVLSTEDTTIRSISGISSYIIDVENYVKIYENVRFVKGAEDITVAFLTTSDINTGDIIPYCNADSFVKSSATVERAIPKNCKAILVLGQGTSNYSPSEVVFFN